MKLIDNCTLQELKDKLEDYLSYDVIEIVYDYYHRNKIYTVSTFASSKKISVSTLYRYIDKVNKFYERYSNK